MFDFIGDIHGHLAELKALLKKLGYEEGSNGYVHTSRKVIFLGDYIDRGPDSPGVVNLVRAMVEAGNAKAIMGNHEYNAILYNTKDGEGYLRKHSPKNCKQHAVTLRQYEDKPAAYQEAINWFKTLPLYFEHENFRAIHACWHTGCLETLREQLTEGKLSEESIRTSADKKHPLHDAVEVGLKGLETHLPDGISFLDKDKHKRHSMRIKWWEDSRNKSLKDMSVLQDIVLPDQAFGRTIASYSPNDKPVFFGHYWLQGKPSILKPNVCCLDYSVAKDGKLCAYRFEGEAVLDVTKLVWVDA